MNDNKPEYILVHCSAYPASSVDRLQTINQLHKDREFDQASTGLYVGYHVLLTGGKKYRCRQDLEHGDHCNNVNFAGKNGQLFADGNSLNFHSVAICIDFNGDNEPVPAWAVPMLKAQILEWQQKYNIPASKVLFHRDFTNEKTCPGSSITHEWLQKLIAPPPVPAPVVPTPAPPVQVVDAVKEQTKGKISLLQTLISMLQELLRINQKSLGSSTDMNDSNFPAWYQSSAGPGISATLVSQAMTFLPVLNFVLQSKGIQIMPETVNFWLTFIVFCVFSVRALVGYVRSKRILQSKVAALKGQVKQMGATPVL